MTIYLLRGAHINQFELQNYEPIAKQLDIQVIGSQTQLTPINIPTTNLWSPADLPAFPFKRQIFNRLIGGEQWLIGLKKVIKPGSSIHTAETYTPYTHQAIQLRKQGHVSKLICTCWETIPHNNEKFSRLRSWKNEAYQYIDIFHTPTKRAKEALIKEGVQPSKIKVIPYGVDISRFHPIKRKSNHKPVILTVARLSQEKGMDIIEKVAQELPQFDFRIIGSGNFIPNSPNITIKSVPYAMIHQEYQHADLFFLPSQSNNTWEEQYGMALIEAMACGLPIVTSNSGAIPEVIGSNGSVLTQADLSGYISAIKHDISSRQHQLPQKYSTLYVSSKIVTLYKKHPTLFKGRV